MYNSQRRQPPSTQDSFLLPDEKVIVGRHGNSVHQPQTRARRQQRKLLDVADAPRGILRPQPGVKLHVGTRLDLAVHGVRAVREQQAVLAQDLAGVGEQALSAGERRYVDHVDVDDEVQLGRADEVRSAP